MDPLTEVRVHGVSEKNRLEESEWRRFDEGGPEEGTDSGSPVDANITPPNANGVEVRCGSMVENALYQRADTFEDNM